MVNTSNKFVPDASDKFMVLECKATGERSVVPVSTSVDETHYDICAYGPTRQSCIIAMFYMKPATRSS